MLAPDLKPKWTQQGLTATGTASAQFGAHLKKESADYARVIKEAGIKGE
jgi:tripartite-type tricarboxylate transporter receptor subunit TctC